jgi:hypothetical protein
MPDIVYVGPQENHMGEVGGNLTGAAVEVTRPANTSSYSANQTVASLTSNPIVDWVFPVARKASGKGYVVKAKLLTNQAACVAHFRLHLYKAAPTPIADGVACTVLYANDTNYAGFIDFPAAGNNGSASDDNAQSIVVPGVTGKLNQPSLPLSFTADALQNLYGLLQTLDAFTPASNQKIRISLDCDDN